MLQLTSTAKLRITREQEEMERRKAYRLTTEKGTRYRMHLSLLRLQHYRRPELLLHPITLLLVLLRLSPLVTSSVIPLPLSLLLPSLLLLPMLHFLC